MFCAFSGFSMLACLSCAWTALAKGSTGRFASLKFS
jgi:hypothetical protein